MPRQKKTTCTPREGCVHVGVLKPVRVAALGTAARTVRQKSAAASAAAVAATDIKAIETIVRRSAAATNSALNLHVRTLLNKPPPVWRRRGANINRSLGRRRRPPADPLRFVHRARVT